MTLCEKRTQLIATMNAAAGVPERFALLIEQARREPPLDAALKTDTHKVEGCLSNLWFVADCRDGKCFFLADADSQVVKAIAILLCKFYSGQTPEEILSCDPGFLSSVGITQHLTPNRRNALSRLWKRIETFAKEHL